MNKPLPQWRWRWASWVLSGKKGPRPANVPNVSIRDKHPAVWNWFQDRLKQGLFRFPSNTINPIHHVYWDRAGRNGLMLTRVSHQGEMIAHMQQNGFTSVSLFEFGGGEAKIKDSEIQAFRNGGISVGMWCVTHNPPWRFDPVGTANRIASLVKNRGYDHAIINDEELEMKDSRYQYSSELLRPLSELIPTAPVGLSSEGGAQALDHRAWQQYGAVILPQCYYGSGKLEDLDGEQNGIALDWGHECQTRYGWHPRSVIVTGGANTADRSSAGVWQHQADKTRAQGGDGIGWWPGGPPDTGGYWQVRV